MEQTKKKSINLSCRLNTEIYSIIEQEANSKGISMNSLINSVLNKYVSLERHSKDIGLISLTQRAIKKIFDEMNDHSIKDLSDEVGGIVHRELVFLKFGQMTFDNLMKIVEINSSRYGSVHHTIDSDSHKFCIHHNAGINFSKFIILIHENMANKLSLKIKIINCDQNIICMEIDEP